MTRTQWALSVVALLTASVLARPGVVPAAHVSRWKRAATLPDTIVDDIAFLSPKIGYAVAQAGIVLKSRDGGRHWRRVLDLGLPYYWMGVHAFTASDVVITGYIDSPTRQAGVLRWTHDGGRTWSDDIVVSPDGLLGRVEFADARHGLVLGDANAAHESGAYTTSTGGGAAEWVRSTPDPSNAWLGAEFSLLPNLHARAAGIEYCDSIDGGGTWHCGPSIDRIFDDAVFFIDDQTGWVAGGAISGNDSRSGWVHRTVDGGATWSGRSLDVRTPIAVVRFVTRELGWAAGGATPDEGAIYGSSDGGQTWSLDLDTHDIQIGACDARGIGRRYRAWCTGVGVAGSLRSVVFTTAVHAKRL